MIISIMPDLYSEDRIIIHWDAEEMLKLFNVEKKHVLLVRCKQQRNILYETYN